MGSGDCVILVDESDANRSKVVPPIKAYIRAILVQWGLLDLNILIPYLSLRVPF